ncbi:hypothetical protein [Enterocloster lavalensis]|uniref:hypothetical protein n=1 Tax=Enterocloster lavalensis TaxID=460384 RepID=UPI001D062C48|nr:hypothetical protein [Enterocloster lavalensis]MCB6343925.1 hypothetical protein [Enterocloster lavalensis]
MQTTSHKLNSPHALSLIETICLLCFTAAALALLATAITSYTRSVKIGNDRLMVETAQRVASLNSIDGCIVKGCDGGSACPHTQNGVQTGYFDHDTNTITGEIPRGYNEYHTMEIDGRTFEGKAGTMVIRIEYDGTDYTLSWVREGYNAGR